MGYAVFAARKIMLTNRINNLNFRIMCLSQQQQSLSDISGRMQQFFGNLTMGLSNQMQSGMNSQMQGFMTGLQTMGGQNASIFQNIGGFANNYYNQMQMQQYQLSAMQQAILQPVAEQENQIELERKRLETQVSAAQKELESVEKAEEKAIERSAPKFA